MITVGTNKRASAKSVSHNIVMEGNASKSRSESLGVSVLSGERYEATLAMTFYATMSTINFCTSLGRTHV